MSKSIMVDKQQPVLTTSHVSATQSSINLLPALKVRQKAEGSLSQVIGLKETNVTSQSTQDLINRTLNRASQPSLQT